LVDGYCIESACNPHKPMVLAERAGFEPAEGY
jgi:hypothetical protein